MRKMSHSSSSISDGGRGESRSGGLRAGIFWSFDFDEIDLKSDPILH